MRHWSVARSATDVFLRCCPPEVVRRGEPEGWSPRLWRELEMTGLAAAGTELPLAEAAEVVRVAAAFAAPVPLAETVLVGPLSLVHRGRASYGRVAAALLSGDGFLLPEDAGLVPAVNLAGEPLDRTNE